MAHEAGALLVVDNTFASPYLQRPLTLGADVVVHSTTKYLGGHSDVVGGALVTRDAGLGERLAYNHNAMGAVAEPVRLVAGAAQPQDARRPHGPALRPTPPGSSSSCWATRRSRRCSTRGCPTHPGHDIAAKQMSGFGGMVSFRLADGEDAALKVCDRAQLFTLAESLGGVESLIEHPGRMTHASAAGSPLEVPADLVRLSVGIEDVDDLLADLEQALWTARSVEPQRVQSPLRLSGPWRFDGSRGQRGRRQDARAVVGDGDGVLDVGGPAAVGAAQRPAVGVDPVVVAAAGQEPRLDRDDQPGAQRHPTARTALVGHVRRLVHRAGRRRGRPGRC